MSTPPPTRATRAAAQARLFIGVRPPPAVLDDLAGYIAGLGFVRAGIRVSARRLWHITVAFLGEVPEGALPPAAGALDRAAATVRYPPAAAPRPTVRLAGGGRFGRGRFTVVWAGVEGDLAPVHRAAVRALRRARLPYDAARRYHPHLTLARPGDKVPREVIAEDIAALARYRGPEWTVGELALYRSYLGPNPAYEVLHTAALPE